MPPGGARRGSIPQACRACDGSNTSVDVRHTLTMNGVYQLPFGQGKRFVNGKGFAS
jgi:hypothetical protein